MQSLFALTLTHSSHNLCPFWSLAIALCFWRLSCCHLCVWEVRFIGFGPGRCPSWALLLTQTMPLRDGVIQRVETQLYNGNSQTKILTSIEIRAPEVKMRHLEGRSDALNSSLLVCKLFLPVIVRQFGKYRAIVAKITKESCVFKWWEDRTVWTHYLHLCLRLPLPCPVGAAARIHIPPSAWRVTSLLPHSDVQMSAGFSLILCIPI